jgi:hypothetical protein
MTCRFRVELERAPCRNFAKPCYGLRYSCSRSRQDFGQHASNASNLWPDRLRMRITEALVGRNKPALGRSYGIARQD